MIRLNRRALLPGLAALAAAFLAGCGPSAPPVVVMAPPPAPAPAPAPPPATVEAARQLLNMEPKLDPRVVWGEVDRFRRAGNREAVFLLVKYAAGNGGNGVPEAAYDLARHYDPATHTEDSIVLAADVREAAVWFHKAARAGHVGAMVRLGEMYRDGLIDPPADAPEGEMNATEWSFHWFDRAAAAGGMTQ